VERLAVVYVRQSTMQQVLEHQESTLLQYGLVQRAVAWGWSEARVLVIDDDLGRSGPSAEGRHGFQRVVAEVGLDHVGLILGVEMSRLARSSKDWHQLLEICALFGRFGQVVEAEMLIRRAGTPPRSYLPFRRPALCLSFRPNSRVGFSSLGGTRTLRADAVWGGSVRQ